MSKDKRTSNTIFPQYSYSVFFSKAASGFMTDRGHLLNTNLSRFVSILKMFIFKQRILNMVNSSTAQGEVA